MLLSASYAALLACASAQLLTLTPFCDNSFRVQLAAPPSSPGLAAAAARLRATLAAAQLTELPGALIDDCGPGAPIAPLPNTPYVNGNLQVTLAADGSLTFANAATQARYFTAAFALSPSPAHAPYLAAALNTSAGDPNERIFGLGQGGWTGESSVGCPTLPVTTQVVVPLQRNGQTINLQQRKFHVSIPFVYSTAGYGLLYHMPGYGSVTVGNYSVGGTRWASDAALALDFWATGAPAGAPAGDASGVYRQYADATGHAPPLREDAMLFWQSRNRYKSSAIAEAVAANYSALKLPVGVLVVDYENQVVDGDFLPNPACFPSVASLSTNVRSVLNATTVFSFWPEVRPHSSNFDAFTAAGCLSNGDLGGSVLDTTITSCRTLIWDKFLRPNYYDQGVSAYWLDETDGEGTGGGDGTYGYNTSFGPAVAYSQLWVGSWLSTFSRPVALLGEAPPLVLARGLWAGGQRYGVVLWSSDIQSSFEQLASMVPQGVHASMSGVPWWTTDVGGVSLLPLSLLSFSPLTISRSSWPPSPTLLNSTAATLKCPTTPRTCRSSSCAGTNSASFAPCSARTAAGRAPASPTWRPARAWRARAAPTRCGPTAPPRRRCCRT